MAATATSAIAAAESAPNKVRPGCVQALKPLAPIGFSPGSPAGSIRRALDDGGKPRRALAGRTDAILFALEVPDGLAELCGWLADDDA